MLKCKPDLCFFCRLLLKSLQLQRVYIQNTFLSLRTCYIYEIKQFIEFIGVYIL